MSGPVFVRAQSPAPTPPQNAFRAIAWNREIPEAFYEVDGKRLPLPLYRGAISQEQRFAGPPTLVLFREETTPDGVVKKVPLATVRLNPPPAKNLLVVWMEKDGSYNTAVLADEAETLPPGHARFINITGRRLALNCNGQTYVTEPGGRQVVAAAKGGVGIKVAVEVESRGKWKLATMSAVRVRPNNRVTVFIADPAKLAELPEDAGKEIVAEPLSLFVITDRVVPAPAGAQAR
ncbi:MAG TPA: hypothetical protein VIO38_09225 [Rariglobus sp.]